VGKKDDDRSDAVIACYVALPDYDDGDDKARLRIRDPRWVTTSDPGLARLYEDFLAKQAAADFDTGAGVYAFRQAVSAIAKWLVLDVEVPGMPEGADLPEAIVAALAEIATQSFLPTTAVRVRPERVPSAATSSAEPSGS